MVAAQAALLTDQSKEIFQLRHRISNLEKPKHEAHYQELLEKRLCGNHLHIQGVGTTDVSTPDAHVEVKRWNRYHEVPGQLDKYHRACPRPRRCVYFFGVPPSAARIHEVLNMMISHGIEMYSVGPDDEVISHTMVPQNDHETTDSFGTWLQDHVITVPGKRIHIHRFINVYGKEVKRGVLATKLRAMGVDITEKKERDPACCNASVLCAVNVAVKTD
jgi:hypothetical protein